jgi:hypothetical protein
MPIRPRINEWLATLGLGLGPFLLTTLAVVAGVAFSLEFIYCSSNPNPRPSGFDLVAPLANFGGYRYTRIARRGYSYDEGQKSNVVVFPAFPLVGRTIVAATGCEAGPALVVVANLSLAAAFVVIARYLRRRFPDDPELPAFALLAIGLLPITFFFRAAYSESMFVLLVVVFLQGLERKWPLIGLALLAGLATATRSVGLGLFPPLLWYAWDHASSNRQFALRATLLAPLACWGIVAYMVYQWMAFDDPLAFIKTQTHWTLRTAGSTWEYVVALCTLEPVWSVYVPDSPAFWQRHEVHANPLFSLQFANPLWFVFFVAMVVVGARRKWLNRYEIVLAVMLLLIPYVTQSYRVCMGSMGRYSSVCVPAYFVMGHLLSRMPKLVVAILAALCGLFLGLYSALFAAGYPFL